MEIELALFIGGGGNASIRQTPLLKGELQLCACISYRYLITTLIYPLDNQT